jgi:hypothetical protein
MRYAKRYAIGLLILGCVWTGANARASENHSGAQSVDDSLSTSVGQQPQQGPQPPAGIPANVKLDLAITDTYAGAPAKKTISMLIRTGMAGRIRTSNVLKGTEVKLNVDAQASTHRVSPTGPSFITVQVTFEYTPAHATEEGSRPTPSQLHESLDVVLLDGKPLVVSQSADPVTERRVTVELTATILK